MKGIAVLGSTGSIGINTLNIIERFPEKYRVISLAAGKNLAVLSGQIQKFRPTFVSVKEERHLVELVSQFPDVTFAYGEEGLNACAVVDGVDIVVVGVVGFAALLPSLTAVRAQKIIALANKEVLVAAGEWFMKEVRDFGATCIPVDSEHCALFQLLEGKERATIDSLILTASGGPLLHLSSKELERVTPEMAIHHPNWKMGPKISIDSATLMNKGLELIEAHFLFGFPEEKIEVWLHPQSIVHGAIRFSDHSFMAQFSKPDMRLSIGYALSYPERLPAVIPALTFSELTSLEFRQPDTDRFPALNLAREALKKGASYLIALNAANEMAVESFLKKEISFKDITGVIEEVLCRHPSATVRAIGDVFALDAEARQLAGSVISMFRK